MTTYIIEDKIWKIEIQCDNKDDFEAMVQYIINRDLPP